MTSLKQVTPLLKVKDVASLLNVSQMTVRRWSDQGILRAIRITGRGDRRFYYDDICRLREEMHANRGHINKIHVL